MTIRIINVHMQTTSFDRMRSKAAQARGEQDEEQERGIYLGYSDNFREILSDVPDRLNKSVR